MNKINDRKKVRTLSDKLSSSKRNTEENFVFCPYLEKQIEYGCCYDMQMISKSYILPTALPEISIDKEKLKRFCKGCSRCL